MSNDFELSAQLLRQFSGERLTKKIGRIEKDIQGLARADCESFLEKTGATSEVFAAAAEMKRLAGQINVTIHALGILLCLPHVLEAGEIIEYVSLGAGNTGRKFDLETNRRVAEFKFINWQLGAESIRQNSLFKDFVLLEGHDTAKRKYIYSLGTQHVIKFLHSRRALSSVLSRNNKLQKLFTQRFGDKYRTTREYFAEHENLVQIVDVSPWLSEIDKNLLNGASETLATKSNF